MVVDTYRIEIPTETCEQLLTESALGRLGVVVDGRPEIFPVSHVYDGPTGSIVFPTNESTKWHAALNWPWVAFEVDGMDADESEGWSVAVVGRAEEVTDPVVIDRVARQRRVRWGGGPGTRWMRVVPNKMTGWRITSPAAPAPRR